MKRYITTRNSSASLPLDKIQFYNSQIPALQAGTYQISITPTSSIPGADNDMTTVSQDFIVQGPRFTLPAGDVYAQSPPPQSSGEFDTQLPYVLLSQPTLPWERAIGTHATPSTPWLALLVFADGELQIPSASEGSALTAAFTTTVADFLSSKSSTDLVPNLSSGSISAQENAMTCQIIKFSAALFKQIAPILDQNTQIDEVSLLAHCRETQTNLSNTSYSVVMANRFPKAMKDSTQPVKNIVHLVSLEGCETYLTENAVFQEDQIMQLVSLYSWSFNCTPQMEEDFSQLFTKLMTNAQTGDNIPLLRLAPTSAEIADATNQEASVTPGVLNCLTNGYVPHPYKTITGENTLAWYRGPLTPVATQPIPALYAPTAGATSNSMLLSASATGEDLLIYNSDTGIYDVSYASAWQIGRQLTLANTEFATNLVTFFSSMAKIAQTSSQPVTENTLKTQGLQRGLVNDMGEILKQPAEKASRFFQPRPTTKKLSPRERSVQHALAIQNISSMDIPSTIVQCLAQYRRLIGLPFMYLVPNETLLPTESIRFFYVDTNWLDALTAGALTIGIHSSQNKSVSEMMFAQLKTSVQGFGQADPVCGFFLRSAVVSAWPNLLVETNTGITGATPVNILSSQNLAPDVLFCLFDGVPQQLSIGEPHEQISFGVSGDTMNAGFIALRNLTGDVGALVANNTELSISNLLRAGNNRVIDFSSLSTALSNAGLVPSSGSCFSASDIAIEFIRAPEQVDFLLPSSTSNPNNFMPNIDSEMPGIEQRQTLSATPLSSPVALLTYTIESNSPIEINDNVSFNILITNNTNQPVALEKVVIDLPIGNSNQDLTADSSNINVNITPSGIWQISISSTPSLVINPTSGLSQPIQPDATLTVTMNVPINNQVGTCIFYLTEVTASATGSQTAYPDNLSMTKSLDSFSLTNFAATPANIISPITEPSSVTLTWNVQLVPHCTLTLYWEDNSEDVTNVSEYTVSTLSTTTVFTLEASVPTFAGNEQFQQQVTVAVISPQVSQIVGTIIGLAPQLILGNAETLSWTTQLIDTCSLYQSDGTAIAENLTPDDTGLYRYPVSPQVTTSYYVEGIAVDGSRPQSNPYQVRVYHMVNQPPVTIVSNNDSYLIDGIQLSPDQKFLFIGLSSAYGGQYSNPYIAIYDTTTPQLTNYTFPYIFLPEGTDTLMPGVIMNTPLAFILVFFVPNIISGGQYELGVSILDKSLNTVSSNTTNDMFHMPTGCTFSNDSIYPINWNNDTSTLSIWTDTVPSAACIEAVIASGSQPFIMSSYSVFASAPPNPSPITFITQSGLTTITANDKTIYAINNGAVTASYLAPELIPPSTNIQHLTTFPASFFGSRPSTPASALEEHKNAPAQPEINEATHITTHARCCRLS